MSPAGVLRMDLVMRFVDELGPSSILEIGAGMGAAGWDLAQGRQYVGYEPDEVACRVAAHRLSDRPRASVLNALLPADPDRQFDLVASFEVLEHIEDDRQALGHWVRWIKPDGHLILSVPAKQERFGLYDSLVGHFRRYDKDELFDRLDSAGLDQIEIRSYGMPLGYLLEGVRNRLLSRRLSEDQGMGERTDRSGRSFQPRSAGAVIRVATYPFVLMQRPFEETSWGIGWVAVARRPD
jgi:SAM-dependent methyltransferase